LRHNSEVFVYNGLDPDEYGKVDFSIKREHLLFLAKASRKEKNLDDCKYIARTLNEKLVVLGGYGFSFLSKVKYKGIIGGEKKNRELQKSKALLFPVRWNEPFGIAIIEALYFGAPVFGTKYGSLPELVSNEVGFLSNSKSELIEAVKNLERYDRKKCNEYVCDNFSAKKMTEKYLFYYDMVLSGKQLNSVKPVNRETNSQELLPMYD
jgi:glycosyltransferase involved in cell wall biosynthesis